MRWAVAVTTAPRSPCTLHECVTSLRHCGWEPTLFAEPGSTAADCPAYANPVQLGVWHNWLQACRWALSTDADLILTSQDDAAYHPDSREYLESIDWPADAAFISLYTPRHYSYYRRGRGARPVGINRIRTRSLWGACALVWRRDVLADVINHRIAQRWAGARPRSGSPTVIQRRRDNPHTIANSDTAIGKICNALGRGMYFVDPSPVSHIATTSTIGHGGNGGNRNAGRIADHSLPLAYQLAR